MSNHSSYCRNGDIHISIVEYGNLTNLECDFILNDILEHEHIHSIIHKFYDYRTSQKFDNISHLLNIESNNKFQKIAHRNHITTWEDVSQRKILLDIKANRKI